MTSLARRMSTPFNITSALLAHVMAQGTGRQPDDSIRSFGEAHLNPMEQARLQLTRESRRLPQLRFNPVAV